MDPFQLQEDIRSSRFDGDKLRLMHEVLRDNVVYSHEYQHLKKPK